MVKLYVDNLHLSYGENPILKGVSVQIEKGEIVVLLGPSGSGKTSLLRAIAGFETPKKGTIKIGDRIVFDGEKKIDVPAENRDLGLVFQSYALWPHRSVFDNVAYGLKLRKVSAAETRERTMSALSQLGLGQLAERFPHQLSGGQQQRVAIARALVYNPPVILLDEPLSNLDAKLRDEAKAWLRGLIVKLELSAVIVTHDQTEAMAIADNIVLLSNGVIEQAGGPVDIYHNPATFFSAEFFGNNNRVQGTFVETAGGGALAGDGFEALRGTARSSLKPGEKAIGIVRAERIGIVDKPGKNRIRLPLFQSMFVGDRWEHYFEKGGLNLRTYGNAPLAQGEHWLEVRPEDFWIFSRAGVGDLLPSHAPIAHS